jgi:hypothetical protein
LEELITSSASACSQDFFGLLHFKSALALHLSISGFTHEFSLPSFFSFVFPDIAFLLFPWAFGSYQPYHPLPRTKDFDIQAVQAARYMLLDACIANLLLVYLFSRRQLRFRSSGRTGTKTTVPEYDWMAGHSQMSDYWLGPVTSLMAASFTPEIFS